MVPRVERTQTSTAVDSDEEPLPQDHELSSLRCPPPGASQVEDVIDSFGGVGARCCAEITQ